MLRAERWWLALVLGVVTQGPVGCAGSNDGGDDDETGGSGGGPSGIVRSADRMRCEVLCKRFQTAGCSDFDHGACVKGCVDAEDFIEETTECEVAFREFLSCTEIQNPACIVIPDPNAPGSEACNDESVEYAECLIDYCVDNPSKDWCSAP